MTRTLDSNTTLFAAMMLATALVLAPTSVVAQNADVAGSWALTVETDVGGTTNPSVTLEQNGATLTGHYSSDTLGEAEVTGTVDGNEVSFSFDAEAGGYAIEVSYTGTLQDDGSLSGNMDLGGLGGGTFAGKKQ